MKLILGTVGSSNTKYEDLSKIFDTVYEHYGKETIIDTGHGYMKKDDENNGKSQNHQEEISSIYLLHPGLPPLHTSQIHSA